MNNSSKTNTFDQRVFDKGHEVGYALGYALGSKTPRKNSLQDELALLTFAIDHLCPDPDTTLRMIRNLMTDNGISTTAIDHPGACFEQ